MAFGVVLFTILVQGTTIESVIERLGLVQKRPSVIENQRRLAVVYARQAGHRELNRLHREGFLYPDLWQAMSSVYEEEIDTARSALRDHLELHPELEREMYLQARADVLKAERNAISDAAARAFISAEVQEELLVEIDARLAALDQLLADRSLSLLASSPAEDENA